jgi:hypothetical protein
MELIHSIADMLMEMKLNPLSVGAMQVEVTAIQFPGG